MEISQVSEAKRVLEKELSEVIDRRIAAFEKDSGIEVQSISARVASHEPGSGLQQIRIPASIKLHLAPILSFPLIFAQWFGIEGVVDRAHQVLR
jgi:hypothetical protein